LPLGQRSVFTVLTFCIHAALEQFGIKRQLRWVVVIQWRLKRIVKLRERVVVQQQLKWIFKRGRRVCAVSRWRRIGGRHVQ
jgi:hypothetical protein